MFENLTLPVVILSSPRTGSTVLMYEIFDHFVKQNQKVVLLNEPRIKNGNNQAYLSQFKNVPIYETHGVLTSLYNKNCILKAHAADVKEFYPDILKKILLSGVNHTVTITRKNFIDQCVSNYISLITNNFSCDHKNNAKLMRSTIPINKGLVTKTINYLLACNKDVTTLNFKPTLNIVYEDMNFLTTRIPKNSKVLNYDELKNEFIMQCKEIGNHHAYYANYLDNAIINKDN